MAKRWRRIRRPTSALVVAVALAVGAQTAGAATWRLPATTLATEDSNNTYPNMAVAADGTATAAWTIGGGADVNIIRVRTRAARSDDFGAAQDLTAATGTCYGPRVVTEPSGRTTVMWHNDATSRLEARTRPAGSAAFGPIVDLGSSQGFTPLLTVGSDGTLYVIWRDLSGTQIVRVRAPNADTFGPAEALESGNGTAAAVGPDGSFTVAWRSYDPGSGTMFIRAQTRSASGTWDSAADISPVGDQAYAPSVAIRPDGTTIIVWSGADTSAGGTWSSQPYGVKARTRPAGSASFGPAVALGAPQGTSSNAPQPQLEVAPDGSVVMLISRENDTTLIAQMRTLAAGSSTFGSPTDVGVMGTADNEAHLAIARDGAITVAWIGTSNAGSIVQARTKAADASSFDAVVDLSTSSVNAGDLALGVAADGSAVAAWEDYTAGTVLTASSAATTYALTVHSAGTGTGTVASDPSGVSCSGTCSAAFPLSSTVTLTATPTNGSTFAGWTGDCTGTAATCEIAVTGARDVTAQFTAVLPSNRFSLKSSRVIGSTIVTTISVPGAGRITQRATFASHRTRSSKTSVACTTSRSVQRAGAYRISCRLNAEARRTRRSGVLRLAITTRFRPAGGTARAVVRHLTVRRRGS